MLKFATLLDQLALEPSRNAKIALLSQYLKTTPDPDRGYALAAITRDLTFQAAKPGLIRQLIGERTDETLFALSYDYVGDLSETVALMWPSSLTDAADQASPSLTEIVDTLRAEAKSRLPALLTGWLDHLDETGRWALLKLITGGLRIGVSARLAKVAVAELGALTATDVEEVWHGLSPPYEALFAWAEGRGARPISTNPAPFRPVMLAHAIDEAVDFEKLNPADFTAEWKWDGIRVQLVSGRGSSGLRTTRLYSRTGDDISSAFPDLIGEIDFDGALDGELLVVIDDQVQPFSALQKRLNRKAVSKALMKSHPAFIRAYDLLALDGDDLRPLSFSKRRAALETLLAQVTTPRLQLSAQIPFASWAALGAIRSDPEAGGAGLDAEAVEGLMLKRLQAPYLPGRPKGEWYKWKKAPKTVDALLMYAQRGHGKRSSYYSDYTFGVWREDANGDDELVPVGKAYFGFTDDELLEIDRFVRRHTINRFGPVREVAHSKETGLVLEIAFEGLNRSTRHKSGIAMRFPRISRLRWDKPPADVDRLETLVALLPPEKTRLENKD